MRIVIELKRDANAQVVLNQLYSYTQLQDTVGVIMLALVDGEPKVLSLKEMLAALHPTSSEQVITRRTQFDLRKAQERAHILEGLKIALDFIDEVIAIIRSSKDHARRASSQLDGAVRLHRHRRPPPLWPCAWASSPAWSGIKIEEELAEP